MTYNIVWGETPWIIQGIAYKGYEQGSDTLWLDFDGQDGQSVDVRPPCLAEKVSEVQINKRDFIRISYSPAKKLTKGACPWEVANLSKGIHTDQDGKGFYTAEESRFWQEAYCAHTHAGASRPEEYADQALRQWRMREAVRFAN